MHKLLYTGPLETAIPQQTDVSTVTRATSTCTGSLDTSEGNVRIFWFAPSKLQYFCTSKPVGKLHENYGRNLFSLVAFYHLNNTATATL